MERKKEMILILASFVLLSILISLTSAEFPYSENIQEQTMSIRIENSLYTSASRLNVNMTMFPLDDERQASVINAFPQENLIPSIDTINFRFNEKGTVVFGVESEVRTRFLLKKLKEISLEELKEQANTSELEIYKKPSTYSDSDNFMIKNKALQLTKSNNSIEILYSLAEYVRNSMNYNLEKQDLRKASEIFQEKQGVCSHYTILFISLARSLGFPSRYVSGVAYSNKINDFQEHAWAEVYIPDYGWVPFDVTFGQYAWLDSSHVAFKKSIDAGEPSAKYRYSGGYIQPDQILIKTNVSSYLGFVDSNITIKVEPYKDEVSQESYVPIKVRVTNNNNYYVALPVRVSIAPQVYGKIQKILLLEPNSFQETYFLIYLPYEEKCSRGCKTYVEIIDLFNNSQTQELIFSDFKEKVSLQEALQVINEPKSGDIDFYCKLGNSTDENKTLICSIKSKESEKLTLCYKEQCYEQNLEKDKLTEVPIEIQTNQTNACIQLKDSNLTLNSCVNVENEKKKSFLAKILDWINFQLTGFIFFIQSI